MSAEKALRRLSREQIYWIIQGNLEDKERDRRSSIIETHERAHREGLAEGRKEGRKEGREEGREEGERAATMAFARKYIAQGHSASETAAFFGLTAEEAAALAKN